MQEAQHVMRELGPQLAGAFVLALLLLVGARLAARKLVGTPRGANAPRPGARGRVPAGEPTEAPGDPLSLDPGERPENPPRRPALAPHRVAEHVPGFTMASFLTFARGLFRRAQRARVDEGGRPALVEHFLPGALDVALNTGPGLEGVGEVWVTGAWLVKAGGTADGCEVHVRFSALVEETRHGRAGLVDVGETWSFGWPPALARWRVVQVERHYRAAVDPPVNHPSPPAPARRTAVAPDLADQLQRHPVDPDAVDAVARLAAEAWAAARTDASPDRLDGLATPAFQERVAGEIARVAHFGCRIRWHLDVRETTLARLLHDGAAARLAVRVVAEQATELVGPDGVAGPRHRTPWAAYLQFVPGGAGGWLLDDAVDDARWVV